MVKLKLLLAISLILNLWFQFHGNLYSYYIDYQCNSKGLEVNSFVYGYWQPIDGVDFTPLNIIENIDIECREK